jgi:UDP-N-acetylmuramyl pentapeptide phosphotransferase/UDP-N-acetylglucosamine-1-phosphate transferase
MRTRVLMLGIAFVLLTTMPIQVGSAASHAADHPQFPTEMRQQHQSAIRTIGGLIVHASTLPSIAQDQTPAVRWPPQPWWADEVVHRR